MGRILLPDNRLVVPKGIEHPEFPTSYTGMGGRWRLRTNKAKSGSAQRDTGWFHNLITNTGLRQMGAMGSSSLAATSEWCNGCAVGTGNIAPTVNDVQLAAYLTKIAANNPTAFPDADVTIAYVAQNGAIPPMWTATYTFIFPTGAAAGNITELGAYPSAIANGQNSLSSRALIVDAGNNPTSITVLSDEILTVTYQTLFYIDPTDHSFTFNVNSSPITGTYRPMAMNSPPNISEVICPTTQNIGYGTGGVINVYSGAIGTNLQSPTGTALGLNVFSNINSYAITDDTANSGTVYVDATNLVYTATQANFGGGITAFSLQTNFHKVQFGNLSTPINKINGQQLSMGFRYAWGRYPGP